MWSETAHWVHWLWGFPGGAGHSQPPPVSCPGPHSVSYKVICRWLLLMLGQEVPRKGQAVKQGWLLLVLTWGQLARGMGHTKARCCLFDGF